LNLHDPPGILILSSARVEVGRVLAQT
jgi:hypothetical protein